MKKLLFVVFVTAPGTILHIVGILLYLLNLASLVATFPETNLRAVLSALVLLLATVIGRAMVVGGDLLSGALVTPPRRNLFVASLALELLAQILCVTAGAFLLAGFVKALAGEFGGLPIRWGIAAILFTATWGVHRAFKQCRQAASADPHIPVEES